MNSGLPFPSISNFTARVQKCRSDFGTELGNIIRDIQNDPYISGKGGPGRVRSSLLRSRLSGCHALRDIPKDGFEGDYNTRQKSWNTCVCFPFPMLIWVSQWSQCFKTPVAQHWGGRRHISGGKTV